MVIEQRFDKTFNRRNMKDDAPETGFKTTTKTKANNRYDDITISACTNITVNVISALACILRFYKSVT